MSQPDLSVVVPLYNEEESLPVLAAEIAAALDPLPLSYEVLYVDDGSTDGSPWVLERLAAKDPRVRRIRLAENSGLSAGLAAGIRHARAPLVATLDADLQNDPADVPRMLEALDGVDVVCGIRRTRRDDWLRRVSSKVANAVRNWATEESVTDVGCTLRVARREHLERVPFFHGMHRFLPTLLKMQGARIREIPVHHRPRRFGKAKYNLRNRIWKALVDLWAVRWMQRRFIDRRLAREIGADESWEMVIPREQSEWTHETLGFGSDSPASSSSRLVS